MANILKIAATIIECPGKLLDIINNDVSIVPICTDIRVDDGVNIELIFNTALSPTEDAQLDALIAALVCDISTVSTTVDQITGTVMPVHFSYGSSVKNRWLSYSAQSSIPSNSTNAVIPFDCKLVGMTFSNKYVSNTDVQIRLALNGAGKSDNTILTLPLRSARTFRKTNFDPEILFSAGDKIGIYCRKVEIDDDDDYPNDVVVILYLQITGINNEEQIEVYTGNF